MKNTIKNIALTAALALTSATAGAQSLTGYFMDNIPNINIYNPVFNPHCKVYVSIYDVYGGFGNSGFAINDMFKHIANGDKYIIDLDKMFNCLTSVSALAKVMLMQVFRSEVTKTLLIPKTF